MQLWTYTHYKWNNYQVIALAKHSDTLEDYVVYQWLYDSQEFGNNAIRVKSVEEFEKEIQVEEKKVKRFEYIRK